MNKVIVNKENELRRKQRTATHKHVNQEKLNRGETSDKTTRGLPEASKRHPQTLLCVGGCVGGSAWVVVCGWLCVGGCV